MSNDSDSIRRAFLVEMLTLGLFAGFNVVGLVQPGHALGRIPSRLPAGKSIYKLRGQVTVDVQQATIDTFIGPNSLVSTGDKSEIIFVVANDAFLLRSNSELKLSGSGILVEGLRILSGKILSVFGKRSEPHTIETSTATIGIRGTGIYVESDPDFSYVCTCYGRTRISSKRDPGIFEDILTEHHDDPRYILAAGKGNGLITAAPVINHSDKELILIEALVGRTPPFGTQGGGYKA